MTKILTEQEQDALFIKQFNIRYSTPHRDLSEHLGRKLAHVQILPIEELLEGQESQYARLSKSTFRMAQR